MITYAEAAELVFEALKDDWEYGSLFVDPEGFENEELYLVPYGAREFLVEGDELFVIDGAPVALVNKFTSEISFVAYLSNRELIESLWPT